MDLNDYWQENKRFVMTVAAGLAVFAVGELVIGATLGDELAARQAEVRRTTSELRKSRFGGAERTEAQEENEALAQATSTLEAAVAFEPRPDFVLDPAVGSPTNQYFARAEAVRERIERAAGRQGMRIDRDLGLPALAPTRAEELGRHLEALDLVERVCDIALEVGVGRIEDIHIELDPGFRSGKETGLFEKTKVQMKMGGPSRPLVQLLAATQDPARGRSLLIDVLAMTPETAKPSEAKLEVTFAIVRPRGVEV